MSDDICWLSAADLLAAYRARTLSPVEVVEATARRIAAFEPTLNAFQTLDLEFARARARESEARWAKGAPMGALDGVPTTIKDTALTRGWPTLHGSRLVDPAGPWDEDAPCTARLREAGCVLLGKTTMPEYGWFGMTDSPLFGVTRNPWRPDRTPGGSSGGAVATLASGIGALAFGNDGGGSVRLPASWTGVFGLKPTFGRVPHYPQEGPFAINIAGGPLARTVTDAALMMNELCKPDIRDPHALPYDGLDHLEGLEDGIRGMKLAYSRNLGGVAAEDQVLALTDAAVALLRDLGAEVHEVGPVFGSIRQRFENLHSAGAGQFLRSVPEAQWPLLDPRTLELGAKGLKVTLPEALAAMGDRYVFCAEMQAFFQDWDLLVTPTLPTTARPVEANRYDRWTEVVPFTYPFNVTGQPAASIPCGLAADGLPVGLQFAGPKYAEARILRACRAFETAFPWPFPHPALQQSLDRMTAVAVTG